MWLCMAVGVHMTECVCVCLSLAWQMEEVVQVDIGSKIYLNSGTTRNHSLTVFMLTSCDSC